MPPTGRASVKSSRRPRTYPHLRLTASLAAVALVVLGVFVFDIIDSRRLILERSRTSSEDLCRLLTERLDIALKESGRSDAVQAEASIFIRELDALTLGGYRFVAVLGKNGDLIMRRPGPAASLGHGEKDEELRRLITTIARSGMIAGVLRSGYGEYVYSALEGQRGFVVVVGESRSDIMAEWRRKIVTYSIAFSVITALMVMLSLNILKDLRHSAELAARLVAMESASDMIVIADLQGRTEYVNPSFERITGLSRTEVLGSRTTIFGSASHEAEAALQSAAEGRHWRGEISLPGADGSIRIEEVSLSPVPGPGGAPLGVVAIKRDVTERRRLQERLERLAHYDSLTGLPNRALFFDRLNGAVARGRRESRKFALLFIDLDGFKAINDRYGHLAGDVLLVETARRLKDAIRDSDTAGRMGGDEFIVLLDNIARSEDASTFADKIRVTLSEPITLDSGDTVSIRASIGVSVYPDDGESGDAVLKAADAAMYERKIKKNGRR